MASSKVKVPHRILSIPVPRMVRAIRDRHKLSRGKLAAKLGVSTRTITRWENGEHPPRPRNRLRLFHFWKGR